jgi:light-regulated signal transduction histidine kinase (bacteriophytochrome)
VANFCQLLERQYAAQLDDRAREYIGFAVDGAKRMQTLIGDLLALSRVGRSTEDFVPVDLDAALDQALGTLADRIAEAGATIRRGSALPTVPGDPALLTSLLENLVGNAVKYRRSDVPADVLVSAETDGQFWTVSVRDNGIGVYPQYAERIFAVFQRLHLRDQYGGTGIGLALCRKIVDFHGGRIWLDELQSGPGATFRFTLPQTGASRP